MIRYRSPLLNFLEITFAAYYWLIVLRIIFSWLPRPSGKLLKDIYKFVYDLTEPVLAYFRKLIPPIMIGSMGFDITPIIALFLLQFLQRLVFSILIRLSF